MWKSVIHGRDSWCVIFAIFPSKSLKPNQLQIIKWNSGYLPWVWWMCIGISSVWLCRTLRLHLLRRTKSFVLNASVIVGYQFIVIDCCTECVTIVGCCFEIVHCTCRYRFRVRQIGCLFAITYWHQNKYTPKSACIWLIHSLYLQNFR